MEARMAMKRNLNEARGTTIVGEVREVFIRDTVGTVSNIIASWNRR
jgi:hypothetical protein